MPELGQGLMLSMVHFFTVYSGCCAELAFRTIAIEPKFLSPSVSATFCLNRARRSGL